MNINIILRIDFKYEKTHKQTEGRDSFSDNIYIFYFSHRYTYGIYILHTSFLAFKLFLN